MEPDLEFGRNWRLEHLPERGKNGVKFGVVAPLHLVDFAPKLFMRGERRPEMHEGA